MAIRCLLCDDDCEMWMCCCECHAGIEKQLESWDELKDYLLNVQKEFEDRNGLRQCKNCGVDFKWLIKEIERFIN